MTSRKRSSTSFLELRRRMKRDSTVGVRTRCVIRRRPEQRDNKVKLNNRKTNSSTVNNRGKTKGQMQEMVGAYLEASKAYSNDNSYGLSIS